MRFVAIVIFCLVPFTAFSKPVHIQLKLESIVCKQTTEKSGDEIYWSVTAYSNLQPPTLIRVPQFPTHWLSQHLPQIKNVRLFEKDLQDNESIQIVLGLIEHDAPPWNNDDHLGSVKLTLHNHGGALSKSWSVMQYADGVLPRQKKVDSPTFILEADQGQYVVSFHLETKS